MRLYLSSCTVPAPDQLFALIGKEPAETNIALIPNALDCYIRRIRMLRITEAREMFRSLGVEKRPAVISLKHFADPRLKDHQYLALKHYDLIWVLGGNTFMLRDAMAQTGFDDILRRLLNEDAVVYGGASAGAVVAGASLRHIAALDKPEFAEYIVWDGLKLLDKTILPHADTPAFAKTVAKLTQERDDVIFLGDRQVLIQNGADYSIHDAEQ
jgi:hypothetical protein